MSALPTSSPFSKNSVAKRLADGQHAADPAINEIFRIEAPGREADPNEPVKLLVVNPNTTASGIMPVWFSANAPSGIHYPCVIVEIHPTEFAQLQNRTLTLPNNWTFDLNNPL